MKKVQLSNEIMEARKKMKEKFNSKDIRGKGISRRKKKVVHSRLKKVFRSTPEEMKLISCIKRINEMLNGLKEIEDYESAIVFIDDIIYFHLLDISKEAVLKKDIWKKIRLEPCEFFEENFYQENEEDRISVKKNAYVIVRDFFTVYGISDICDLFTKIEKSLSKKEYLEENTENEDEMNLTTAYQLLDINRTDNIKSSDLIKIYRKKALLYHPDKHPKGNEKYQELFTNIYKAYKFLLKRI